MPSKMVLDREKTATALQGALKAHASKASAKFLEVVAPELRDEDAPPDMEAVQRLLRRRLDRLQGELVAAEAAHQKDLEILRQVRARRDAAVAQVAHLLARLRSILSGLCGRRTCTRLLGFDGNTPRDPVVLHQVARRLVETWRQDTFHVPDAGLSGLEIDPIFWSGLLQEPVERLGQAIEDLALEQQGANTTLVDKQEAMATYDHTYRATARMLQQLYRYVGMTELAKRVAPPRRRRKSRAEDAAEDQSPPQTVGSEAEGLAPEDLPASESDIPQKGRAPRLLRLLSGRRF